MKKIIAFLLAAAMILCFVGCTDTNSTKTTDPQSGSKEPVQDSFSCTYNGATIALHAPAATILTTLGEADSYSESTSCAFEGLDKIYTYGSLNLQTYPIGDKDYIYGWWFEDDVDEDAHTPEGIRVGSTQAEAETAYGADAFDGKNTFEVTKGSGKLTIILKDGAVKSIQYAIIAE